MVVAVFLLALCQTPPPQPASGPGGSQYAHASVSESVHRGGDQRYWIFEPAQPTPPSAPVVLYLHGYGSSNPDPYRPLLEHLARKGFAVVYPRYGSLWNPWVYEDTALDSWQDAISVLQGAGHVTPQLDKLAVAGHSLGGILSLRLAHRLGPGSTPFQSIVIHDGAGFQTPAYPFMPLDDLSGIPAQTGLVLVVADTSKQDANATEIVRLAWTRTPQIPRVQKNGILLRSDFYGQPDLISDHLGVQTWPTDAIDFLGYWKFTEAALNHAFWNQDGSFVFGDGSDLRYMGLWSDGQPVQEAVPASDFGF